MKVLISAYACEPHKGSEPAVGWHWVEQIARFHEVWVITRANNKKAIEAAIEERPQLNLHFHYIDLPTWVTFWKKGQRGIYLYYYLWQFFAYSLARQLQVKHKFDLVHHITFVIDWLPSFMCLLPVPFIWGPIGSNSQLPRAFQKQLSKKNWFKDKSVSTLKRTLRRSDIFLRCCLRKSRRIIAINKETVLNIPQEYRSKVSIIPAIGVDSFEPSRINHNNSRNNIRIMSSGDLRYLKGFHLAIHAFNQFIRKGNNGTLLIIGEGKERRRLWQLVKELGIQAKVKFEDKLPQREFLQKLRETHVFLFPSFEGGGMVVLEAMANGKPVVCLDYGGPGEMIKSNCGFKIPIDRPDSVIASLADALETLANSPKRRRKMGEAGRKRVQAVHQWEVKGNLISRIYQEALANPQCQDY